MIRKVLFILLLITIATNLAVAGNTGKLVGVVTDKNTGEPLAGVNIILKGTPIGAATDLNGEYFILNIPPGSYDIECAYIGYQPFLYKDVQILSDQTTALNFELSEQTMELEEQIVVVAERPLVQKDLTYSKKITTTEEIKAMPVETYAGIMLTQAGVTQGADGAIHIRGGRSEEVAYLVDGVSVANPFSTNGLATSVANNAIQEMTVVSGAFNAEYGNAMSGVVNFTTKDGSPEFETFLSFYSGDYISDKNHIFTNIDDVNPLAVNSTEGTISGPLSLLGITENKNHTFFFSTRYTESEGHLYGVREHLPTDSANFELKPYTRTYKDVNDENVTETIWLDEWYIEMGGDSAYVPMNPSRGLNLLGKLKFQLLPNLSLRIQSLMETDRYRSYVHAYKYVPDGTYRYRAESYNNSLQLSHTLSNSTFYDLRLAYNTRNFEQYAFEDYDDSRYAPSDKIQGDPGGTTFLYGGAQNGHIYETSQTYLGKFDLTSQVNKNNLIKAGVEARMHVLDRESFYIAYDRILYNEPTKIFGSGGAYMRYPRQVSAYLQDKLEYEDMIINAGLRYDYFYSDALYTVDPLQPDGEKERAKPKNMLAPRLAVSFPITATGIVHLSYGHFYQMPTLRNLYSNPDFFLPADGIALFGNANLNPEKTIMYEVGLQQQFGDQIALNITGFYKDIRDLLAWQTIKFRRLEGDYQDYRIRRNQDYANVKGMTIEIEKRMTKEVPVSAKLNYTYQIAEGNDNNAAAFYFNSLSGQENIKEIIPLDWDQTHNIYATITTTPFEGLVLSMIGKISTGYPYSPQIFDSNYDTQPNSTRKPTQKDVDLRLSYRFAFWKSHLQLFLKVYNLFDTLNERYVFNDTGRATYTFANRSVGEPDSFKKHYGEEGVHTYDEYNVRPHYYSTPRQVRLGFSIEL